MSDLAESEFEDEAYADDPPPLSAAEVDALVEAGWHLRRIRSLRARRDEVVALYDREITRINEWRATEVAKLEVRIDWHEAPLRQLSERLHEADPKRKTISLPDGSLNLRVPEKPQVFVSDPDALLEWARENAPSLLPEPKRINVTDLRREAVGYKDGRVVLTSTGELVPHAKAEVPEPTWSCRTADDDEAF